MWDFNEEFLFTELGIPSFWKGDAFLSLFWDRPWSIILTDLYGCSMGYSSLQVPVQLHGQQWLDEESIDYMSEDLSRGGCPKSVSRGFSLEILEPWVHGRGEFSTLSTFHQGQEYSRGAWLGKSLASKEGWPWVGGKQEAGGGTPSCSAEGSTGDFQ